MAPVAGMIRYNTDNKYFERSTNEGSSWAQLDLSGQTIAVAQIPSLPASIITSGTFSSSLIPSLDASKITTGTIATARLGSGSASSSTYLRGDQTWQAITSGADAALSNLASVAINSSLLPGTDNAIDLGSAAKSWRDLFADRNALIGGTLGVTGVTTLDSDLAFSTERTIRRTTADGSDNGYIEIAGGGAGGANNARGAWFRCYGNEGGIAGSLAFEVGNVTGSKFAVRNVGSSDVFIIDGNTGKMSNLPTYNNTTASAANVFVDSGGLFWRSTSSLRYKDNVEELKDWKFLLDITPVTFISKKDRQKHIGLIAENVALYEPRLVEFDGYDRPDEVQYGHFVAPIIAAIKDLFTEIQLLKGLQNG